MKREFSNCMLYLCLSAMPVLSLSAQSFSVTYDFAEVTTSSGPVDPTALPAAPGLVLGAFSVGGYAGNPSASGRFSWTSNPTGGVNGSDDFDAFSGSVDLAKYFSVTLTPAADWGVDLEAIRFTVQRSGTGIRNYAVRSSLDEFSVNLAGSIDPGNANLAVNGANEFEWLLDSVTTAQNGSLITLGGEFQNLSSPVTFRFYGWNAEAAAGTFSIDNVTISGVAAVPEPGSAVLLGMGAVGLGFLSRRKGGRSPCFSSR